MPQACGSSHSNARRSAPEPVPRSARRSACEPPRSESEGSESRLDHGLALGPGQEGFRIELEPQPPKFFVPDDARDRFASEPPRHQCSHGGGFRGRERASRLSRKRSMIEPERVSDEQACIEIRAIEAMIAELARRTPAYRFHGHARMQRASGCAGSDLVGCRHPEKPSAASSSA